MKYRLSILPRAADDLQEMFSWIEDRSATGAGHWYAAFEAAALNVVHDPESCAEASESGALQLELREFRFRTSKGSMYRAVFQIRGNEVCILRVRGPGQSDLSEHDL